MKLDKLVYDVREALAQYQDDSLITDDYIIFILNNIRSKIIRNQLNNYQDVISPLMLQSFCLELEEVSAYDCGYDLNCDTIIRTARPVPIPIKHHYGLALTTVRTMDRLGKSLRSIEPEAASYFMNSRFSNSIYYFVGSDLRLYFVSKNTMLKLMDCISITGIFADPLELEDYSTCCGCDTDVEAKCFNMYESDYPIDPSMVDDLTRLAIEKLLNKLQINTDNSNNATDD